MLSLFYPKIKFQIASEHANDELLSAVREKVGKDKALQTALPSNDDQKSAFKVIVHFLHFYREIVFNTFCVR
jgi:hypothetical protein